MEEDIQGREISFRDYLDLVRRRKAIILQTFVVVVCAGLVVTMMAKPRYRASVQILVEGKRYSPPMDPNGALPSIFTPDPGHTVDTQLVVLTSPVVLKNAYARAGIPPGSVRVTAEQVRDTDVVQITAESGTAIYAEKLVKALPDAYAAHLNSTKHTQVSRALEFARTRMLEETEKLRQAERELQLFKAQNRIADLDSEKRALIEQVSALEQAIGQTMAQISGVSAQLATLTAERNALPRFRETPTVASNTAAAEALRTKIDALENQRAALAIRFKPEHMEIQQIDAQIRDLKERLAKLPAYITTTTRTPNPDLAALDTQIMQARSELATKRAELARQQALKRTINIAGLSDRDRRHSELLREVERSRTSVASMTRSVEDLSLREKAVNQPVNVIAEGGRASRVGPRAMSNFVLAAVFGLMLGFLLAVVQEYLDDRINTPDDARRVLDAPILSYVPLVEAPEQRLLSRSSGGGSVLEAYRVMRSNVQFATVDAPSSSLVVTSTAPGEGKSVTAVNLAVAMALDGRQVVLVDADLRRPTIHEKLGLAQRPGLTNVLIGHLSVEEALQETATPGLRVLTAGPLPPNPAELLNSRTMASIHEQLRDIADVVIFDSPPFLATADAQVLSAQADGVIYVIQLGEAKKAPLRHAADLINQAHARVVGIVFNKIDLRSRRDDYYYGYYRYYNYYHTPELENGDGKSRHTSEFEALVAAGGADGKKPALTGTTSPNGDDEHKAT